VKEDAVKRIIVLFGLVTGMLFPAAVNAAPVCAAAPANHAALVVTHATQSGTQTKTFCVVLDAQSVSGIHLIELAANQFGLSYVLADFGEFGSAVCALDGVGFPADPCFGPFPGPFWGYYVGDGSGGWVSASVGASSRTLTSGDIDGWVFEEPGVGLPRLAFGDVCVTLTPPPPPPAPGRPYVQISKVRFNPGGHSTDLNREFVTFKNLGDAPAVMDGWSLTNRTGNVYVFPVFTLQPGAMLKVHTGADTDSVTHLYISSDSPLWNDERDRATLRDLAGSLIDRCSYVDGGHAMVC
jgi:lamin tail-like protein